MYTICTYTASVLVEGTKNMIIVWMVLAVTGLIALVYNLNQLSCNMVQAHWFKIQWFVPYYVSNFTFFKLYLNTLKKPWTDSGIKGRCIWIDFSKLSLDLASFTKNLMIFHQRNTRMLYYQFYHHSCFLQSLQLTKSSVQVHLHQRQLYREFVKPLG